MSADRIALTTHFVTFWEHPNTLHDNGPARQFPEGKVYCRFTVVMGDQQPFAGASDTGLVKQLGRIWLQVFLPEQAGVGAGDPLIADFVQMFRHARLDEGRLTCGTPEFGRNNTPKNGYVMRSVNIPFHSLRRYSENG